MARHVKATTAAPALTLIAALLLLALVATTTTAAAPTTPAHAKKTKKWCPSPSPQACGLATEAQYDALVDSLTQWTQNPAPFIAGGTATVGATPGPCAATVSETAPSGSTATCFLGTESVLLTADCPQGWAAVQGTCYSTALPGGGRLPITVSGTFGTAVNCEFSTAGLTAGVEVHTTAWVVCSAPYVPPTTITAAAAAVGGGRVSGLQQQLAEAVMPK